MTDTAPTPRRWERQPFDTDKSFEAFAAYRDQGPERSITEAARRVGKQVSLLHRWSTAKDWVARCREYDAWVDEQTLERNTKAILDMRERHARAAMALQAKAVERLATIRPNDLTPRDALAFLVEAVKIERTARGMPEQLVAHTTTQGEPAPVAGGDEGAEVSLEALRRLEASLAQRARAGRDGG